MQPHRRQPTSLPCPWDSPGKNTGVGCHFLLQCMKVKSEREVTQSCLTLATPWTAAYQAPSSMGFSRQKYWSGVPLPSPMTFIIHKFWCLSPEIPNPMVPGYTTIPWSLQGIDSRTPLGHQNLQMLKSLTENSPVLPALLILSFCPCFLSMDSTTCRSVDKAADCSES